MVGFAVVLQHRPRTLTFAPPSETTLPPPVAVVKEKADMELVVTVGTLAVVLAVNVTSKPYAVPTELVAKALT